MDSPPNLIGTPSDTESSFADLRRAPRVAARLKIVIQMPGSRREHETRDLSYSGLFIECDDPLPLRQLVRLLAYPDGGDPLPMLGLIAHRINAADAAEQGRAAGMGLELYAVGAEARRAWRALVRAEYERDPEARERLRERETPRLKIRPPTPEAIEALAHGEFSSGTCFMRCAELKPIGSPLSLVVVHPDSGARYPIACEVTEIVETPRADRGLALRILEPEATVEGLTAFAAGTTP